MISVVVPLFNEDESLNHFFGELKKELKELHQPYEVIFVDDGSTDSSLSMLKKIAGEDERVRVFSFRANQGKAEALTLGFQKAKGDLVVTLDADLQDQPSEIKKLIEKNKEGFEVVCGWRKERKDASNMKAISRLFNYAVNKLFGLSIHDYNCGLKLYTNEAAKELHLYGGMHRFIPILLSQQGFSIAEVAVQHEPRKFGTSKYKFTKIKDLPDIFTMLFLVRYTKRPLHFFGTVGGVVFMVGSVILIYLSMLHFMGEAIGRRPLLFFGGMFMLSGLQIFFTGFLAELMIDMSNKGASKFALKFQSDK